MKPQIYSSRERHESLHCFVKQTWYNSSLDVEWSSFECYLSTSSAVFKVILHQPAESSKPQPSWPSRNTNKQSCRGRGFALQGIRVHAPKPGWEILLVHKRKVNWPLINGRSQTCTVHSKCLPVVFRSSMTSWALWFWWSFFAPCYSSGLPLCFANQGDPLPGKELVLGLLCHMHRPVRAEAQPEPLAGATQPAHSALLHVCSQLKRGVCPETDTSLLCRQTSDSQPAAAVWACRLPRHLSCINFNVNVLSVKNNFFHMLFTTWLNRKNWFYYLKTQVLYKLKHSNYSTW